jgi:hypothetical protein
VAASLGLGSVAQAGRPLLTDDTGTVAPGHVEVEAGVLVHHRSDMDHVDVPGAVTVGLRPGWEAGVGCGAQWEERMVWDGEREKVSDVSDVIVDSKWMFLQADATGSSLAIAPAVKLPLAAKHTGGTDQVDYDLMLLLSQSLGRRANLHGNLGHTWVGSPADEFRPNVLHGGVALDFQLNSRWQWVGELAFNKETEDSAAMAWVADAGLRWMVADGLTLDLAAGGALRGDAPDWFTTGGLTWNWAWK